MDLFKDNDELFDGGFDLVDDGVALVHSQEIVDLDELGGGLHENVDLFRGFLF